MSATDTAPKARRDGASEPTRTAKLFKNGRSQAVRLPKEFRFEGTEVAIRRNPETGEVVLSPNIEARKETSWADLFAVWDSLGTADFDFERHVSYPIERDFF